MALYRSCCDKFSFFYERILRATHFVHRVRPYTHVLKFELLSRCLHSAHACICTCAHIYTDAYICRLVKLSSRTRCANCHTYSSSAQAPALLMSTVHVYMYTRTHVCAHMHILIEQQHESTQVYRRATHISCPTTRSGTMVWSCTRPSVARESNQGLRCVLGECALPLQPR